MSTQYTVHQAPSTKASFRLMNNDSSRLGQLKDKELSDEDSRGPILDKQTRVKPVAHRHSKYAALLEAIVLGTTRSR